MRPVERNPSHVSLPPAVHWLNPSSPVPSSYFCELPHQCGLGETKTKESMYYQDLGTDKICCIIRDG